MSLAEGFIVLDCIGIACAIRVFVVWIRQQGWNPLEWRGVVNHALDCTFCLPFWCSLPVMFLTDHSPLHAFGIAALGFAFFDTFLPDSAPPPSPQPVFHVERESPDWEARDVLTDTLSKKKPERKPTLRVGTWTAPGTGTFVEDDARFAYEGRQK